MKKTYTSKYLITLLLVAGISAGLQAQSFKSIDINKTTNANPANGAAMFSELNGIFYFQADDGIHGAELYRSDGNKDGTWLVKDIMPGIASSSPTNIITFNNRIYFTAHYHDPYSGDFQKIWVSDGTDTGTTELDFGHDGDYPTINYLTDVNGILYFSYFFFGDSEYPYNTAVGKSDGTASGTVLLTNDFSHVRSLINVNGRLFFTASDAEEHRGIELFTSNGTAGGTILVKDINQGENSSSPHHMTALNGLLYFTAFDGATDRLWVSDGTANGTHPVKNAHNIYLASDQFDTDYGHAFAVKDNTLYFQGASFGNGTSTLSGYELCAYNTSDTSNGITMVKDIIPGQKSSNPVFITNVDGTLYFSITPDSSDAQLWKSDGTGGGTVLVKDINPGGINNYSGLFNFNGTLLFAYGNDSFGTELWKSNGTGEGTVLVKDIYPGFGNSNPAHFTYNNGTVILSAGGPEGNELWKSDGTEGGTALVKDINHTTTPSSNPSAFTSLTGSKIIFNADDGRSSGNLFVTDGSDGGTKLVSPFVRSLDINNEFIKIKDTTYFIDSTFHLWKTDGTKEGTSVLPIPAFANGKNILISNFGATAQLIYIFTYNTKTGLTSLWRTNGTPAGTFILKTDLFNDYYFDFNPIGLGNILFFAGNDAATHHSTLWSTDGTKAGTILLITSHNNYPVENFCIFKGKLFFDAATGTGYDGGALWSSDGTVAGTTVIKDIKINSTAFGQAKGKLFFDAFDETSNGYELFTSDGTSAGTLPVTNKYKGTAATFPQFFVSGDTLVYFLSGYGTGSTRLFKSDGTSEGTVPVKQVEPSRPENLVTVHNNLFFVTAAGIYDTLWQSNGTEAGTHAVTDTGLNGIIQINNLKAVGNHLYFSAKTNAIGNELYVANFEVNKPPTVNIINPANSQVFLAGGTVHLQAAAGDPDGTISKVEFYNGTTLLTTEHKIHYTFNWRIGKVGNYVITAKATDNKGATTTSAPVNISVVPNKAPSVSIINPVNWQIFTATPGGATINLEAAAEDPDGRIVQVSFYHGATLLTDAEHKVPYTYQWKNVPAGTYTITAIAKDNWSAETTSAPIVITVVPSGEPLVSTTTSLPGISANVKEAVSIKLMPNPVKDVLNINTTGLQKNKQSIISVISASGVTIKTLKINSSAQTIPLRVSSLAGGVYILKITCGDKILYKQFVKW